MRRGNNASLFHLALELCNSFKNTVALSYLISNCAAHDGGCKTEHRMKMSDGELGLIVVVNIKMSN